MSRLRWVVRLADGAADLVDDVLIELGSRRARALMMVAAVGLSTGALLASIGISQTASRQIGADIAASTLDLVTLTVAPHGAKSAEGAEGAAEAAEGEGVGVSDYGGRAEGLPSSGSKGNESGVLQVLPADTEERLASVDLIEAGGRRLNVSQIAEPVVTRLPGEMSPIEEDVTRPGVVAATADYLHAARTDGPEERFSLLDHDDRVVMLVENAAKALDVPVTSEPTGLQVWINGEPYDVVGFLGNSGPAALGDAVVVPYSRGVHMAGDDMETTILVRSVPGAGTQVSKIAALAVRPDAPELLLASPVTSVDSLRRGVSTQMDRLAAWTGVILMGLTTLLIANSMVVAVMARTGEIGLRRALGSSRAQVAGVFLAEGALIGMLGGLIGAALASAVSVTTAAANGWTATLEAGWIALGPVVGIVVGLIASAYPAQRASTIQPALAVRAE